MRAGIIARNHAFITSRHGFLVFILGTLAAAGALRLLLFPGIGGDDGEQLIFAQAFDWGYQLRNPPLYTWIVIAAQSVVGVGVHTVIIVKLMLLAGIYLTLWRAALRLIAEPRDAALAAAAPMALYYLGWDSLHGFSHSVLVTLLYAATLLALLRLDEAATWDRFVGLGVALGLGILSKYAFALFAVALLGAAMFDPHLRGRLTNRQILATLVVAAAIATPHLNWLSAHIQSSPPDAGGGALKGIGRLIVAAFGFLSPLWLFLVAAYWPAVRARKPPLGEARRWCDFFERYFLILAVIAVLGVIFFQVDRVRTHYMFVLIPFPLYFLMRFSDAASERFAALLSLAALIVLGGMVAKYLAEPINCERCQHHIPYPALAAELTNAGFTGGTIFADWYPDPLPGNLRARFPDARVISAKHPTVLPPPRAGGQCLLVWPITEDGDRRSATIAAANRVLNAGISEDAASAMVAAPLAGFSGRAYSLGYLLISDGAGDCR